MATKKATSTKKKAPVKKSAAKTTSAASKTTVKTAPAVAGIGSHVSTSLRSADLWRALGAEFIGTFLLAATVIVGQGQPIFLLFGVVGIVLLIGGISGAHINPAVTVGAWVTRRIGWLRAIGYIIVQILGAIAAYYALKAFIGGAPAPTAEALSYGATAQELFNANPISEAQGKEWFVFFAEVLGTAVLGFAVANATRAKEALTSAFSVGGGLFIALMIGITVAGYVGASSIVNPAVAVALQGFDASIWSYAVYALAPVVGGVIGFVVYDLVRGNK